jgi:hypothetical protein
MKMEETGCSTSWHIKFRRWGITQKNAHNNNETVVVQAYRDCPLTSEEINL